jgi:transcription elongation factor
MDTTPTYSVTNNSYNISGQLSTATTNTSSTVRLNDLLALAKQLEGYVYSAEQDVFKSIEESLTTRDA